MWRVQKRKIEILLIVRIKEAAESWQIEYFATFVSRVSDTCPWKVLKFQIDSNKMMYKSTCLLKVWCNRIESICITRWRQNGQVNNDKKTNFINDTVFFHPVWNELNRNFQPSYRKTRSSIYIEYVWKS